MVSERKRLANGRNAKRSTGPKDTRHTRYNAQKHGMLSQAAIIQDGDAKEDPRELESLFDELWEDLKPVGKMEEILVDEIVSCVWRKRRAKRAEVGEIRRVADIMNSFFPVADGKREAVGLSQNLPHANVSEKIPRYETAIDRQMYRALKELRELQAARRARSTRRGASDNGL